jgi:hypothetical protein
MPEITDERLAGYRPLAELKTAAGLDGKPEQVTEDIEYLTAVYALTSAASCANPKDHKLDAAATALGDLIEVLHIRALAEVERLQGELATAKTQAETGLGIFLSVEKVLTDALGPDEEDGTGDGTAADVALAVHQRDEARAELAKAREALRDAQLAIEARNAAIEASDEMLRIARQIVTGDAVAALRDAGILAYGPDQTRDEEAL